MIPEVPFQSLLPLVIFSAFVAVFYFSNKKKNEVLRNLSGRFNGSLACGIFSPTLKGQYHGFDFSIVLVPAGKSSPEYLKISLAKNSLLKLTIHKESVLSNIGKKLGLVHEVKVNDESFDSDFLIFSNDSTRAAYYFRHETIKNTIKEFFSGGFNLFTANGKALLVQKPNYILEKDLDYGQVLSILQKLILLANSL